MLADDAALDRRARDRPLAEVGHGLGDAFS
jgi:hypothetical protein